MNKTIKWLFNKDDNWFIAGVSVFIIAFLIMIVIGSNANAEENKYFTVKNVKKVYKVVKDKEVKINYYNSSFIISEDNIMWTWKKVF